MHLRGVAELFLQIFMIEQHLNKQNGRRLNACSNSEASEKVFKVVIIIVWLQVSYLGATSCIFIEKVSRW